MKFTSAFLIVALQAVLPLAMGAALAEQACKPVCCDAIVPSANPQGKIGINCSEGGFDCGFGLQVNGCCARVLQGPTHTGIGCQ
ncbi:hypothetical protein CPC08DRAFT_821459 [Agrocybe pediades]|nr:hypothetical protein CPC08DRAFT_821459 [Agrocybe pediades]